MWSMWSWEELHALAFWGLVRAVSNTPLTWQCQLSTVAQQTIQTCLLKAKTHYLLTILDQILFGITEIVFLWVHSCCCRQLASQKETARTHALMCLCSLRRGYLESLPMDSHIMAGSLLGSPWAIFQGDHKSNFNAYWDSTLKSHNVPLLVYYQSAKVCYKASLNLMHQTILIRQESNLIGSIFPLYL